MRLTIDMRLLTRQYGNACAYNVYQPLCESLGTRLPLLTDSMPTIFPPPSIYSQLNGTKLWEVYHNCLGIAA